MIYQLFSTSEFDSTPPLTSKYCNMGILIIALVWSTCVYDMHACIITYLWTLLWFRGLLYRPCSEVVAIWLNRRRRKKRELSFLRIDWEEKHKKFSDFCKVVQNLMYTQGLLNKIIDYYIFPDYYKMRGKFVLELGIWYPILKVQHKELKN